MLFNYQLSPDDRLARKAMEEFRASRTPEGLVIAQYPTGLPLKQVPQFSLYFILMAYDHMRYFADKTLVRSYLGTADSILNYFEQRLDRRGVIGQFEANIWLFVHWVKEWFVPGQIFKSCISPAYHSRGAATIKSLFYAMTPQHAAEICDFANRTDTATEYRVRAQSIRDAVNAACRGRDGLVMDGPGVEEYSQHTQIFAILSETFTGADATALMRRKDDVNARSDCHGWSASPLNEIVTQVFGVTPARPGFARVRIEPHRALVEQADGTLYTPAGDVRVGWARDQAIGIEAVQQRVAAEVVVGSKTSVVDLVPGQVVRF
ncbi:uncharacterized protein BO97DRAFT_452344 [Aspergillus homomorphus CBS 101889]|uniref:Alpha-L-rhamnosidase six-hairpin glycosidase domain-containing protein n=1 Tax=Aspergillus homomorphus (strain CBS 101889) TaxID=1450537 RepID=A0A395HW14_ASPHC|nr:hypothetical protein BO97DRAFT_452344 [Aspergillus homomorphus CBS 101889]RAL12000.1 hypothetical protein BO97DRAFT_452344 [Aspergillus homomorphus CBS 101889]